MLVVGLLLLAAAVVVGAAGVAANTGSGHQLPSGFTFFGYHLQGSSGRLLLAGLVIGAVAMLGFMMTVEGVRRDAALRRELGRFRRDARSRRRAEAAGKNTGGAGTGKAAPAVTEPAAVSARSADTADTSADGTAAERSARRRGLRGWRAARPVS